MKPDKRESNRAILIFKKLRHAHIVSLADALVAIELVEETLLVKYKTSLLGFKRLSPNKRNIELYGTTVRIELFPPLK
jgi:hypothetical protein